MTFLSCILALIIIINVGKFCWGDVSIGIIETRWTETEHFGTKFKSHNKVDKAKSYKTSRRT